MIDGAGGSGADGLAGTSLPGGEGVDVVVLAGGTGRRLGGASKPDVVARGARLLDHVLAGLKELSGRGGPAEPPGAAGPRPGRVVVVAPEGVALPAGVTIRVTRPAASCSRTARPPSASMRALRSPWASYSRRRRTPSGSVISVRRLSRHTMVVTPPMGSVMVEGLRFSPS